MYVKLKKAHAEDLLALPMPLVDKKTLQFNEFVVVVCVFALHAIFRASTLHQGRLTDLMRRTKAPADDVGCQAPANPNLSASLTRSSKEAMLLRATVHLGIKGK